MAAWAGRFGLGSLRDTQFEDMDVLSRQSMAAAVGKHFPQGALCMHCLVVSKSLQVIYQKSPIFHTPSVFLLPLDVTLLEFHQDFRCQVTKLEMLSYHAVSFVRWYFSRFDRTAACDTDIHTH